MAQVFPMAGWWINGQGPGKVERQLPVFFRIAMKACNDPAGRTLAD